jgi:predicted O-methyltransferase YrrM
MRSGKGPQRKGRKYGYILERVVKKSFQIFERFGFHITLNHFYEPIPDTRTLKDDIWSKQSELVGIDANEEAQMDLLSQLSHKFKEEYSNLLTTRTTAPFRSFADNQTFTSLDGEIYYCMIRHFKPKRIIEIGSGYSTLLGAQAVLKNKEEHGMDTDLIAVEPYPIDFLARGFDGLSELVRVKAEDVELSEFGKLKENDILFIDSSHVLRIGGDVQYIFLEVLPRLNNGVLVHFHDIFFPMEYPKQWVLEDHRFWNEQYFLQAFLSFNSAFEVLWAGNYMHLRHPKKLEGAFSSYDRDTASPSSFWIRKRE